MKGDDNMSGRDFVIGLHREYGLLEAHRMGKEYVESSRAYRHRCKQYGADEKEEEKFCQEILAALDEFDNL